MNKSVWGKNFINLPPIKEEGKAIVWRIPWLDFIRKWHNLPFEENPFAGYRNINDATSRDQNRLLILNGYHGSVGADNNVYSFTESYWTRETENHSWVLKFVVFVDNAQGRARIECYDATLVEKCEEFTEEMSWLSVKDLENV